MKFFFQRITENYWFSVFDFFCVVSSILLIEIFPQAGGIPLLIALLPWTFRILAGEAFLFSSRFDVFPLIFLVTVWLSIDSAYDPQNSWSKWWLLVGSVLLYFSLLHQSSKNFWIIASTISVAGAIMAVFFLLANDWQIYPAKIFWINQVGLWWMKVRPEFLINRIYHNSAAGIIALTLPFTVTVGLKAWKDKRIISAIWSIGIGCISVTGLILTTSRGAVLALFFGFLVWAIKILMQAKISRIRMLWMKRIGPGLIFIVILVGGIIFIMLTGPVSMTPSVSVLLNSGSRLELYSDSIRLVEDFPFIGAGLNSFSGVYSNYILNIPVFIYENSHNLYLNVALEQGILGSVVLCFIYFFCILSMVKHNDGQYSWLVDATLTSLVIIVLHNLVDNVIDGSFLTPVIFIIPGFARALAQSEPTQDIESVRPQDPLFILKGFGSARPLIFRSAFALIVVIPIIISRNALISSWYANLGDICMSKVELADFPSHSWAAEQYLPELGPSQTYFLQALQYNPDNRSANDRLGLIAMMRQDYPAAIVYFEKARKSDPGHRGVIKSLGYSYVWNGQLDTALPLLQKIPESQQEMETYTWWWTTQNRPDLSVNAALMASQLKDTAALSSP
jgi:O-antigen ligase